MRVYMNIKEGTDIDLKTARDEILSELQSYIQETKDKYTKYLEEKEILEKQKQEALMNGDLSENMEYHTASEKLADNSKKLENLLKIINAADSKQYAHIIEYDENATIYTETTEDGTPTDITHKYIDIGSAVKLQLLGSTEHISIWVIVPGILASIERGTLSDNSPVGSKLLGMEAGRTFSVTINDKKCNYKILEVY